MGSARVLWISTAPDADRYEAAAVVFQDGSSRPGWVSLRSADPRELPFVERGFLTCEDDIQPLLDAIGLARRIAEADPLRELLESELRPGATDPERYLREMSRSYFHPVGTCAIGSVVDARGGVYGLEGLTVADASIVPVVPRANTNLTTAAVAERIAETL